MRFRSLALWLAAAGALALPASAAAVTQTAQLGQVSASFSYDVTTPSGGIPTYSGERLTITRAGTVVYSAAVEDRLCGTACSPGAPDPKQSSVHVVAIDGGSEPQVVLDLYTGGAHCCSIAHVLTYAPAARAYVATRHDFGDPGYLLKRIGGRGPYRFVTADDNFAYAFTAFAASGLPLQILGFQATRFVDVTRHYPALIGRDAAEWWRVFRAHETTGEGVLAPWAADEELLGHDRLVQRTLQAQLRAGHLVGGDVVNGRAYIRALNKLLRQLGYRR